MADTRDPPPPPPSTDAHQQPAGDTPGPRGDRDEGASAGASPTVTDPRWLYLMEDLTHREIADALKDVPGCSYGTIVRRSSEEDWKGQKRKLRKLFASVGAAKTNPQSIVIFEQLADRHTPTSRLSRLLGKEVAAEVQTAKPAKSDAGGVRSSQRSSQTGDAGKRRPRDKVPAQSADHADAAKSGEDSQVASVAPKAAVAQPAAPVAPPAAAPHSPSPRAATASQPPPKAQRSQAVQDAITDEAIRRLAEERAKVHLDELKSLAQIRKFNLLTAQNLAMKASQFALADKIRSRPTGETLADGSEEVEVEQSSPIKIEDRLTIGRLASLAAQIADSVAKPDASAQYEMQFIQLEKLRVELEMVKARLAGSLPPEKVEVVSADSDAFSEFLRSRLGGQDRQGLSRVLAKKAAAAAAAADGGSGEPQPN